MAEGANPEVGKPGGRRGGEPRQGSSLCNHPGGDGEEGETTEGECALDVHTALAEDLVVGHLLDEDRHHQLRGGADHGEHDRQPQPAAKSRRQPEGTLPGPRS